MVLVGDGVAALALSGDRAWYLGDFGAVFIFGVLFAVVLYLNHFRSSLSRFRRMQNPYVPLYRGSGAGAWWQGRIIK